MDDGYDIVMVKEPVVIEMPEQNKEAKTLLELLNSKNGVPKGWEEFFESNTDILERLDRILKGVKHRFYPSLHEIFRAFHTLPTKEFIKTDTLTNQLNVTPEEFNAFIVNNDFHPTTKSKVQHIYILTGEDMKLVNFPVKSSAVVEKPEGTLQEIKFLQKDDVITMTETYTSKKIVPDVKIVIVGQDPYFTQHRGENTAMGMSFSCRSGHPISPSLKSIFTRLEQTVPGFKRPFSGDLTKWANQGVFLFNMALTVPNKEDWMMERPNDKSPAGAHNGIWEGFAMSIVEFLAKYNPKCIYFLWGKKAQDLNSSLPSSSIALESSHPSPLGMRYGFNTMDHFMEANQILDSRGDPVINWSL